MKQCLIQEVVLDCKCQEPAIDSDQLLICTLQPASNVTYLTSLLLISWLTDLDGLCFILKQYFSQDFPDFQTLYTVWDAVSVFFNLHTQLGRVNNV